MASINPPSVSVRKAGGKVNKQKRSCLCGFIYLDSQIAPSYIKYHANFHKTQNYHTNAVVSSSSALHS